MTVKLWYLASPYSHADKWVREIRFRAVSRFAGALRTEEEIFTFCPIAHSHPISEELADVQATDYKFWLGWDKPFEDGCEGLIVCQLPGWKKSTGVGIEIPNFKGAGKPVIYRDPRAYFTAAEWAMLEAGLL